MGAGGGGSGRGVPAGIHPQLATHGRIGEHEADGVGDLLGPDQATADALASLQDMTARQAKAEDNLAALTDRIAQLDDRMSDYRPRSELMRLCENSREGPTPPLPVSADLFDIFATSREVAAASDGAFDITVGPLVQAWRHARREARLPTPEVLQDARARVGWESLLLDPSARTVSLQRADMRLDLGGIAKGYAAERAVRTLKDHGVPRCLVAMSGDIVVGDPPPGETGWRIELPAPVSEATACHGLPTSPSGGNITQPPNLAEPQAVPHSRTRRGTPNDPFRGFFSLEPFEPGASFVSAVRLANAAISTSGDSQQFIEIDGVRYSHIVDPRTGLGVTNRVLCTVIAPTGEVVDAVASAICVLGVDPNALTKLHAAFPTAVTIIWN